MAPLVTMEVSWDRFLELLVCIFLKIMSNTRLRTSEVVLVIFEAHTLQSPTITHLNYFHGIPATSHQHRS